MRAAARAPAATMAGDAAKLRVVVTGAGGRTGKLIMQKLLDRPAEFEGVGVVRSEKSAKPLRAAGTNVFVGDLCEAGGAAVLASALEGADRLVIATSAVPQIVKRSLIPVLLAKLLKRSPAPRPRFRFKAGQAPEVADWSSQRAQIDAAKAAGVGKVVVVGSMGGTQPDNFLNSIGDGKILLWKRRAERYLLDSGLDFAIVHPGGLLDAPGGEREVVLGVDDALLAGAARSIPRADVAELCLALLTGGGARRAVDAASRPPGEGEPTADWEALLAGVGDCSYADMDGDEVLAALKA
jgi:uncharacterized protein YbjT (DUF2867 family)